VINQLVYKASIPTRIISVFYFAVVLVVSEYLTIGLVSGILGIDMSSVHEYGLLRMLAIVIAKLMQIFFVEVSVSAVNWKTHKSSSGEAKLMLPLLLCQVFSIVLAYFIFIICLNMYDDPEVIALLTMTGILYMNAIVFWYFDRIKRIFIYKGENEAAELKIELHKKYSEFLCEQQKETDALWHDMKKHTELMKTLINYGQHEITSDYLQKLESAMYDKVVVVRTQSPVLSALLTEQKQRAKKASIEFDLEVRLESEMRVEPVDLCVILGNMFDNALEACNQLPPDVDGYVKASILQRNKALSIEYENAYNPTAKPVRRDGKHGLGLKIIRKTVKKYDGVFSNTSDNSMFKVSVLIP
jgi:hypothetical protein